jgi:pyruvate/2-oxoglutarate dehydrogenase complex dihydrolipoamide acyltransferase (E2) component
VVPLKPGAGHRRLRRHPGHRSAGRRRRHGPKDQGLVTLESDKATMEVPSSVAGVVKELKVKVGDTLSQGAVVAIIEAEGAAASAPARPLAAAPGRAKAATKVEPVAGQPDKLAAREIASAGTPSSPPVQFNADGVLPAKVPYATPAVRVFARELGVDLPQVNGTEEGRHVTRATCRSSSRPRSAAACRPPPVAPSPPVVASTCCRGRRSTSQVRRDRGQAAVAHQEDLGRTWPATGR